jgi:uncharacterized protein (DUF4415 family)
MTEKRRATSSDLAKVDAHEIAPEEYEEIPELIEEDFARGRWHIGGVPVKRGRPKSDNPKQAVNLRLDADVLAHFRATGSGWQGRINQALRKAAKLRAKERQPTKKARLASK